MSDTSVARSASPAVRDLIPLAVLAIALLAFLLTPFVVDGYSFPLGPDAPVYLWWTRIAGAEGISAAGDRPGAPALLLELTGTTGLPLTAVVAGVEVALGAMIGVLSAILARTRGASRPAWLLAGALAGVFSVHLVAGYLANLIFVVGFLGAAVCLASRTRRGSWAAAALLGGTGLAHPYFFLVGAGVLLVTAGLARRDTSRDADDAEPGEERRIVTAVLGAGAIVGAGLLSILWGARPPDVETSRDGFLRRAGLGAELASAYRDRFVDRWTRYVQWASLPLAAIGIGLARGFVARLLLAWSAVTVVGVLVGLAFAWYPPDRFVTFGFAIPILAGLGIARAITGARGRWRPVVYAAAAVLSVAMVLGASFAWFRNEPYITEEEVHAAETAGRFLDGLPMPALFSFPVEEPDAPAPTFELARAWNVVLASVPADRIREPVPSLLPASIHASEEARRVGRVLEEIADERPLGEQHTLDAAMRPFIARWPSSTGRQWEDEVLVVDGPETPASATPRDPLGRTSPGQIALASIVLLLVLGVAGFGWAAASVTSTVTRVSIAPAFGAAALILTGLVVDRVGIRLDGPVPAIAAVLAAGSGYAFFLLQRRTGTHSAEQVEEHPH
ncbi:MAG: hypothetical protein WEA10_00920 [Actinomycetota bacterium]